jgi:hypothetical protein
MKFRLDFARRVIVKHATQEDMPKDSCVEVLINGTWTYIGVARFNRSSALTAFLSKYVRDFEPQAVSPVTRLQAVNCGVTRVAIVSANEFREHFTKLTMDQEGHTLDFVAVESWLATNMNRSGLDSLTDFFIREPATHYGTAEADGISAARICFFISAKSWLP